jgi:hypothetical protein
MKIKLTSVLVLGALAMFASTARATSIRTGSSYGQLSNITSSTQPFPIGDETVVCESTTSPSPTNLCTEWSLLLQINDAPTNPDLNQAIQLTLPGNEGVFGVLNCNVLNSLTGVYDTGAQLFGSLCTPNTNPLSASCDLGSVAFDGSGTIVLPGSCITASETFFFDENTNALASPSLAGSAVATPEPGSLALLAISLILMAAVSRRRLQA